MRRSSGKAFLLICILLCVTATFALLFSCGSAKTYTLSMEGDLYPGSSLSLSVLDETKTAVGASCTFAVTAGKDVAQVQDGVLTISKKAQIGDSFVLSATGEGISLSATCKVAAPPVTKVSVVCEEEAAAGDALILGAKVLPSVYSGVTATFTVTSGNATISDNTLLIGADADRDDVITVTASYGGVVSVEKRIYITTYQPKRITITSDYDACLPGDSLSVSATVSPSYVKYPLETEIEEGGAYAHYDKEQGKIFVDESADMGAVIVFKATCNTLVERVTYLVGHPTATDITAESEGRKVVPGETKNFDFTLYPATADRDKVDILLDRSSSSYVEWQGGTTFTVLSGVERGSVIAFILRYSEEVQTVIAFTVEPRVADSISLSTSVGTDSYLASGETATFTSQVFPVDWAGDVYYDVLEGADLVAETSSGVFTVKQGADRGIVRVQAKTSDGIRSDVLSFSVRGRYLRRVCTSWDDIDFSLRKNNVWFVLPYARTADRTIIVPRETTDLILEGHYDGTEETAYQGLYFYFRNADAPRTVTLSHFATSADYGLGGTVMEFGSSGETIIVLEGLNAVRADTPRYIDRTGEIVDGEWSNKKEPSNRDLVWRSGKMGYNGVNGGTAMSGSELIFKGDGTLVLTAGDGTDGATGGKGANARYIEGVLLYVAGNGGAGGNGGDSGVAIRADKVTFASGFVRAIAGNAGKGAAGGAAGNVTALDGYSVTAIPGEKGSDGKDGVCLPAVYAGVIVGEAARYSDSQGTTKSTRESATESLSLLSKKLAAFYGIDLYYGSGVTYTHLNEHKDYTMTRQTDDAESAQQLHFLQYTLSMMPKNCWREFHTVSSIKVSVYLVKNINSGKILGLTDSSNNVWFATFETEVRGVIYGGYYNIMLHEFTHVCHYNMKKISAGRATSFETALEGHNYGLEYTKNANNERVYGVEDNENNSAENCCFLSSYSRTNSHEDTAETLSMCSEFTALPDFLRKGTAVRAKFDLIVSTLGKMFETMTPLTAPNLFAYDHLFDEEESAA